MFYLIIELGDNLEGKNSENEVEEMSTFGVSTVNSSKSLLNPQMYSNSEFMQLQQKNEGLVEENNRYFFSYCLSVFCKGLKI